MADSDGTIAQVTMQLEPKHDSLFGDSDHMGGASSPFGGRPSLLRLLTASTLLRHAAASSLPSPSLIPDNLSLGETRGHNTPLDALLLGGSGGDSEMRL